MNSWPEPHEKDGPAPRSGCLSAVDFDVSGQEESDSMGYPKKYHGEPPEAYSFPKGLLSLSGRIARVPICSACPLFLGLRVEHEIWLQINLSHGT
jgi:hypothetical protein